MRANPKLRLLLPLAASLGAGCPQLPGGGRPPLTTRPPTGNVVIGNDVDAEETECFDTRRDESLARSLRPTLNPVTVNPGEVRLATEEPEREVLTLETSMNLPRLLVSPQGAVAALSYDFLRLDFGVHNVELWRGSGPGPGRTMDFFLEAADFASNGGLAAASIHHDADGNPYVDATWNLEYGLRLKRFRFGLDGRTEVGDEGRNNSLLGEGELDDDGSLHLLMSSTQGDGGSLYVVQGDECALEDAVRFPELQPSVGGIGFREDGEVELAMWWQDQLMVGSLTNPEWSQVQLSASNGIFAPEVAHDERGGLAVLQFSSAGLGAEVSVDSQSLYVRRGPEWTLYPLDYGTPVCGLATEHPACTTATHGIHGVSTLVQGERAAWVAMAVNHLVDGSTTPTRVECGEIYSQISLYRIAGGEVVRFVLPDALGFAHGIALNEDAIDPRRLYVAVKYRSAPLDDDSCDAEHYIERLLVTIPEE